MNGRCVFTDNYETIYERMKAKYEELSGAEFDQASDIAIRLRVLAGEIFNAQSHLEWLRRQMFPSTATGEYLDYIAQQRGLSRRPAAKATGYLVFSVTESPAEPVFIPAGTVVATAEASPIRIYTTEDAELRSDYQYVSVPAEAEEAGFRGNIPGGLATVPVNVPPEIDVVYNSSPFHGGFDEEADETLRGRIKDSYLCAPNAMNAAYYIQLAMSVDGVEKAGVVPYARGAGTFNIYVCGNDGEVEQEIIDRVDALIQSRREVDADVQVRNAIALPYDLYVTVEPMAGYTQQEITEIITAAFEEYLSALPAGGKIYLSSLGKYLLETGCIETYRFDTMMYNAQASGSQYFTDGEINIEVAT